MDNDRSLTRVCPSDLRQIPDNQEVFLSPSSDTSLVVEVLAMVEDGQASTDLWEAVKWVRQDLDHNIIMIVTGLTSLGRVP